MRRALAWSACEPVEVVVERVQAGGGKESDLPHRSAEQPAVADGPGMRSREPASSEPPGAPSPLDSATDSRSNGAASSAIDRPLATDAFHSRAPSR